MAAVLLGSAVMPLINDMSQENKTGLAKFTFSTVKCKERRFSTPWSRPVCSCLVVPKMRMLSITQSTPDLISLLEVNAFSVESALGHSKC